MSPSRIRERCQLRRLTFPPGSPLFNVSMSDITRVPEQGHGSRPGPAKIILDSVNAATRSVLEISAKTFYGTSSSSPLISSHESPNTSDHSTMVYFRR
jgi:hypothetical protein